ncbi:hypothetical protein AADZ90_021305 [Aestuariibius sp. 2305UL40-4]|uniref:hypothetical protein n=1 Tax=Aestuariibius violaceus TaxID=3234132 RepID=UPI00345E4192
MNGQIADQKREAAWFWEQKSLHGGWQPVTGSARPVKTADGRLKRAGGTGPRVRSIKEVAPEHRGKSLDDLRRLYGGEDGAE